MDRSVVRLTTLKAADDAFCLRLSILDRIKVLEELNAMARRALGYPVARLNRQAVRVGARPIGPIRASRGL